MEKTSKTKLLSFIIMLNVTIIAAATAMVLIGNQSVSFAYYRNFGNSVIPSGYHYEATDATRTTSATKEYWVACNTHTHYLLQDPEVDEIDFVDDISNDSSTGFTVKLSDPYWVGSSTWDGTGIDAVYPAGKGISTGDTSVMGEISFTFSSAYTSGESITIKEGSSFLSDSNGSDVYYNVPNCYEFIYDGSSWSLNKTPVYGNWVEGVTPSPDISEFFQGTDDRWARYDQFDGSEVQMWVKKNDVTFGSVSTTIGGRTGTFYEFDTTPAGSNTWQDKLIFYHASHNGPDANYNPYVRTANSSDLRRLLFKDRIRYATFDICFSSGSLSFGVATYDGSTYITPTLTSLAAGTYIKNNNNITCYELNGQEATTISNNTWYRVVVRFDIYNEDGSFIESPSNMYAGITVDNRYQGVSYFDNVRYYRDSSWWDDFETDLGLVASISDPLLFNDDYIPSVTNVTYRGETITSSDYSLNLTVSDSSKGDVNGNKVSRIDGGGFDAYMTIITEEKRVTYTKHIKERHSTSFVKSGVKTADVNYLTTNQTYNGRTGLDKYIFPSTIDWNAGYCIEETKHSNGKSYVATKEAYLINNDIRYFSFDFCLTAGSRMRLYARTSEVTHGYFYCNTGSSVVTSSPAPNYKIYDSSGNEFDSSFSADVWYTCLVDYSFLTQQTDQNNVWIECLLNASIGTFYIDNVCYYSN